MPALTDLDVQWVSLVDRAAVRDPVNQSEPMRFLVWKSVNDPIQTITGGSMKTAEELQAALTKAEQDATAATERAEKAEKSANDFKAMLEAKGKKDDEAKKAEEINKDELPPAVRAALEKAETEATANRERAEKAETKANEASELAKAERDARVTREFVTKAEGYKALVIKADDFGPVLKEASEKLSKESFAALEQVLKAADEGLAATDLFKEQGRSREGNAADSAYAEATKKAEEIRKADPKIPLAKAMDMAFEADPALQTRYLAEQR